MVKKKEPKKPSVKEEKLATSDDKQRKKALVDKYLQGELSRDELNVYLNVIGGI